MIPYGKQTLDQDDIDAVLETLSSDWLTQGPKVSEFEQALASYSGCKYAVAVSNGTAALHCAYMAAGLSEGDEVITTPNTFAATSNMLLAVGAKPVFCDIRSDTYNIDETKIESLITNNTKAIVPVHFAGQACEMNTILAIAQEHDLIVVEDAPHAFGAKYRQDTIGSLESDMTTFSFHPVKPITTAEGGAIVTNHQKYYERLVALRIHGIHKDEQGKNIMTMLGFNYRITDLQCALGISQLPKLDQFICKRRHVVEWYAEELQGIDDIAVPTELGHNYSGWHLYVIRVINHEKRDDLMEHLKENGIGVNFHYPAVYSHPYYRKLGFENFSLPNTEIYHSSCITLPIFPTLKQEEVKYICDKIKEYFKQ